MTELKIRIKPGFTLADVAMEVVALNQFVDGDKFPRPIFANPQSKQPETFLGSINTPPDADGFVTVRLADYDYLDLGFLPQQPTTFTFVYGSIGGSII